MAESSISSDLGVLTRLVCTGSEDGCFNVQQREDFRDKTPILERFYTKETGLVAVRRLKRIYERKSYVGKEALLYTLASIIRNTPMQDTHREDKLRRVSYQLVEKVCETAEELFTFVHFDKETSPRRKPGWGRGMREMIRNWYDNRPPLQLARLVTRCKSARGWAHKCLLRRCHVVPMRKNKATSLVVNYLLLGKSEIKRFAEDNEDKQTQEVINFLRGLEQLNISVSEEKEIIRAVVEEYKLCDRQIPSRLYNMPEVFEGMLSHISISEVLQHSYKMAMLGMVESSHHVAQMVVDRLSDQQAIMEQKVPPMEVFAAISKYAPNRKKAWVRNNSYYKALMSAYQISLQTVAELHDCRMLIATHLQDEVRQNRLKVKGASYVKPVVAVAHLIKYMHHTKAVSKHVYFNDTVQNLNIDEKSKIHTILENLEGSRKEDASFDLAEPIKWARQQKDKYECIFILTDLKKVESAQAFHEAVRAYRHQTGIKDCKVAVVGLSDTTTVVADKSDFNLLEVSGYNEDVAPFLLRFFQGDLHFEAAIDIIGEEPMGVWDAQQYGQGEDCMVKKEEQPF